MKKIIYLFIVSTIFINCSVENDSLESNSKSITTKSNLNTSDLDEIAKELVYDENYINFIEAYLQNSIKVSENLIKKYESKSDEEKESYDAENINLASDITAYFVLWIGLNESVKDLDEKQLAYVADKALWEGVNSLENTGNKMKTFGVENRLQSVIGEYEEQRTKFNLKYPVYAVSNEITIGEAIGCVVGGLTSYISDNYTLGKQLLGLFKGEKLTLSVVTAGLKLFFPQAKLAGTIASVAVCLIYSYLF